MVDTPFPARSRASNPGLGEPADRPPSRRRFLKMFGAAGSISALGIFLPACGDDANRATAPSVTEAAANAAGDLAIVNYVLRLEYLQADFYEQILDRGLVPDLAFAKLVRGFGESEQEHVGALKITAGNLGGEPAEKPKTDLDSVFDGGLEKVLTTVAGVENLAAAAYLGQAGAIQDREILAVALAIHSVEARQAAALNRLVGRFTGRDTVERSLPNGAFAQPLTMEQALEQVEQFFVS